MLAESSTDNVAQTGTLSRIMATSSTGPFQAAASLYGASEITLTASSPSLDMPSLEFDAICWTMPPYRVSDISQMLEADILERVR